MKNFSLFKKASDKPDCYPDDYTPGKQYGSEVLAKIFCCIAGSGFGPENIIRSVYFPPLPGGADNEMDPDAMQIYGPEPITMADYVKKEMSKISHWAMKEVDLSLDNLSDETLKFVEHKRSAPGYEKRVGYQKDKVRKSGLNPNVIISPDEPICMVFKDGKYEIQEGWHRSLSLLDMLGDGEFGDVDSIRIPAAVGYSK
jgi:hypothetical protein